MALYAIGDLHLCLGAPKPMDIFGEKWSRHDEKIKNNWIKKINKDDTLIDIPIKMIKDYIEENFSNNKVKTAVVTIAHRHPIIEVDYKLFISILLVLFCFFLTIIIVCRRFLL